MFLFIHVLNKFSHRSICILIFASNGLIDKINEKSISLKLPDPQDYN